jgi:hypothetical protein
MSRIKRINQYGVSDDELGLEVAGREYEITAEAFGPLFRSVNRQIANPPRVLARKGKSLPSKAQKNIPKEYKF